MLDYINEGDVIRAQFQMYRHHMICRRNRGENVVVPNDIQEFITGKPRDKEKRKLQRRTKL
jgi:hypothetical protein